MAAEFFVWGSGWLAWGMYGRGVVMLAAWFLWLAPTLAVITGTVASMGLLVPLLGILFLIYTAVGLGTARALLITLEQRPEKAPTPEAAG